MMQDFIRRGFFPLLQLGRWYLAVHFVRLSEIIESLSWAKLCIPSTIKHEFCLLYPILIQKRTLWHKIIPTFMLINFLVQKLQCTKTLFWAWKSEKKTLPKVGQYSKIAEIFNTARHNLHKNKKVLDSFEFIYHLGYITLQVVWNYWICWVEFIIDNCIRSVKVTKGYLIIYECDIWYQIIQIIANNKQWVSKRMPKCNS